MSFDVNRCLKSSWVWGFWARLAVADQHITQALAESRLQALVSGLPKMTLPWAFYNLALRFLSWGWVGVLVLCTFAETSLIALGVWMMVLLSLVFARISAPNTPPNHSSAAFLSDYPKATFSTIDLMVALFWACGMISTLASSIQPASLNGAFKLTTMIAAYGGMRIVLGRAWPGPACLWAGALMALGGLQGAIGLWQFQHHVLPLATWSDPTINPEIAITRVFGTLKPLNPNLYAGFLLSTLPAVFLMAGFSVLKRRGVRRFFGIALSALVMGFILFGLAMSGSRGGYLGLFASGLTAFALLGYWLFVEGTGKTAAAFRKLWLGSGFLVTTGVVLLISLMPALRARILSIGAFWQDSSIAYRLQVYQTTWQMIQDNWLLGIGPGNETFRQIFGAYAPAHLHALGAYSISLEILVELGLVGGVVALGFLILIMLRSLMVIGNSAGAFESGKPAVGVLAADSVYFRRLHCLLILVSGVAIMGVLANGLFDTVWYRPAVQIPFWLWVSILVSASGQLIQVSDS
ncbi:MAG: O-antigen ligase family protein [Vampirovibrionales bacterium]|nr:O-antigen ligase family protein [Vampirovibrionales bacterium]